VPFPVDYGGGGFPWLVAVAIQEMLTAANMAFSLCPFLTQGAIDMVLRYGSETQREMFLPKMITGEWTGTMNLTESNAGSDVGALTTKAVPAEDGTWRMQQEDIDRVQEFRKCIECFLCQDVCHVLRDHHKHDEFIGPRLLVHVAALEMHPLDTADRVGELKEQFGIGYCNITKCCTKVCPEHITITDNAIIPLKERVVDRFYDPVSRMLRVITGR